MSDMYEVVLVRRATGKVVPLSETMLTAAEADAVRTKAEQHVNPAVFDVCVQRVAGEPLTADAGDQVDAEDAGADGVQL